MLTQIEIDGFKTFKDFKVELAPFQVIVGPNGSGKSILFDALQLLSRLADVDDLRLAFQASDDKKLRGDAYELFTKLPGGGHTERMQVAVELLVEHQVQDSLGQKAELKYRRLRYELEITQQKNEYGLEQLFVASETLRSIPENEDKWCKRYDVSSRNKWLSSSSRDLKFFISTMPQVTRTTVAEAAFPYESDTSLTKAATEGATIHLHEDQGRPGKFFRTGKIKRTIVSSVTDTDFPHAFAVREEMRSWKLLYLNPVSLRKPSPVNAPAYLSKYGDNLPATLARIQAEDEFAFHLVSLDIANLVPGILNIRIEKNPASNEYDIWASDSGQISFSAQSLSDGTLRLLALSTIRNDPQFHGVLCLEEPENGIDPLQLKKLARLLREMATDFGDTQQMDERLRQIIITTHSPSFISQPEVLESLLLTFMPSHIQDKGLPAFRVTRMVPVIMPDTSRLLEAGANTDKAVEFYSIDQLRRYLGDETFDEARAQLEKARMDLDQR